MKFKEKTVISGISGRYPESDNIDEFWSKLLQGTELYTADDRRWPLGCMNLPRFTGKLKDISRLDADFFGVSPKDANFMDPQIRILHETIYEAIWDAGLSPLSLRGSKTGFFVGYCYDDTLIALREEESNPPDFLELGVARISYAFDWHGPAILIDTACASSFSALNQALLSIVSGDCDQAIVAGVGIQLWPNTSAAFHQLNMLSDDGKSKCLDSSADGYCRSEAVVAMLVQKESASKRIYARILDCQTNCDGYKPEGITFPKYEAQLALMRSIYKSLDLDPLTIDYVEAHVTGTKAGDPVESAALVHALRPDSDKTLLVGCLKSNMGHSEGASALCAITKVVKIFQNGCIPPNINFNEPNPFIESLIKGVIKPVLQVTPYESPLIAVNSFGFGGVNVHSVLEANLKRRSEGDKILTHSKSFPRLIHINNRTTSGLSRIVSFIESQKGSLTCDTLSLINDLSKIEPETGLKHRGYLMLDNDQTIIMSDQSELGDRRRPLWVVFSPLYTHTMNANYARQLISIPEIANWINSLNHVLLPYGINLITLLTNENNKQSGNNLINSLISMVTIQMATYELIKLLQLKPDGIIGHSLGEIVAAYADQCLTGEQVLLIAYWIGVNCLQHTSKQSVNYSMVKVNLNWETIESLSFKSSDIQLSSQESKNSTIITGPVEVMKLFVHQLTTNCNNLVANDGDEINCQPINSFGIPFGSSSLMAPIVDLVEKSLKSILTNDNQRSDTWLITSAHPKRWDDHDCQFVSANYFTRLLRSPSYFYQASNCLPANGLFIEMGSSPEWILDLLPDKLGSSAVRMSMLTRSSDLSPVNPGHSYEPGMLSLLKTIGSIYLNGHNPSIEVLYPKVTYPVARETPSLGHLLDWDHSAEWLVARFPQYFTLQQKDLETIVDLLNPEWKFIRGHCIDGRILFPATGYLYIVWCNIAYKLGEYTPDNLPIEFFDVKLYRATIISVNSPAKFTVYVNEKGDHFTIKESDTICATGRWRIPNNPDGLSLAKDSLVHRPVRPDAITLGPKDIYKEFRVRGYDYGETFQGLTEVLSDGSWGRIKKTSHWISMADSALQISLLGSADRKLYLPNYMEYVFINQKVTLETLEISRRSAPQGTQGTIDIYFDRNANIGAAPGLLIKGAKAAAVGRRQDTQLARLETTAFSPYDQTISLPSKLSGHIDSYSKYCLQCIDSLRTGSASSLTDSESIQRLLAIKDESHSLLNLLYTAHSRSISSSAETDINQNQIESVKDVDGITELKSLLETQRKSLVRDLLYKGPLSACLESQLSIIGENICVKQISVADINFSIDSLSDTISDYFTFIGIRPTTNLVIPENLLAFVESSSAKVTRFYHEFKRMGDIHSSDLIVLRDSRINLNIGDNSILSEMNNFFELTETLEMTFECLKEGGFMLLITRNKLTSIEQQLSSLLSSEQSINSNDKLDFYDLETIKSVLIKVGFTLISTKTLLNEGWSSILVRKCSGPNDQSPISTIRVTNENFDWIESLKDSLIGKGNKVWLVGSGPTNGIIGLTTCLRKEPRGNLVRCLYYPNKSIDDKSDLSIPDDILEKDLAYNIIQGSSEDELSVVGTLSAQLLDDVDEITVNAKDCYVDVKTKGDLSSFRWFQAQFDSWPLPLPTETLINKVDMISVYYGSLNFKDVMVATGRIPVNAYPENHYQLVESHVGMEYSGIDSEGQRVMGICVGGSIGTSIMIDSRFYRMKVPDNWTLAQAASIPVVYFTAYYGLFIRGNLKRGESVLIHAGTGGVGQAAISICLSMGCEVFTTVGTQAKREYIKSRFPVIDDAHIADSRSTSFEDQVLKVTNGRGVDLVLNSLAEDKFKASIRCLADCGRFIEIGKYDLVQNTKIDATILDNNKSYHACCLAHLQEDVLTKNPVRGKVIWDAIQCMIENGIKTGEVVPLPLTIFESSRVEEAFRFMASGKHLGKVLIKLRDESSEPVPQAKIYPAIGQTFFRPDKVYIITGGLGGLGLELAHWMVKRCAAKLVLTSRQGPREPYQHLMLDRLRSDQFFNTSIIVSNENCQSAESVERLLTSSSKLGPIGGIFHLAMVLKDSLLENQTPATFEEVMAPKATSGLYLDQVSRKMNLTDLDYFVCFSSISSGKGNPGQSNYGLANSTLERICEKRRADGLHGLAIQWGALGDVGVVAELMGGNDINIAGTIPQRLPSIFDTLDKFLLTPYPVVSSIVLADKRRSAATGKESLLRVICHILGVKDHSKLDPESTLSDLGLDSLMAVEIKQGLERDYNLVLSTQEIRGIKIKDIPGIEERKKKNTAGDKSGGESGSTDGVSNDIANSLSIDPLTIPSTIFAPLMVRNGSAVLYFPPIEGNFLSIKPVLEYIMRPVTGVNWVADCIKYDTIQKVAEFYVDAIREKYPNEAQFDLVGYSFGGLLALEVAMQLQQKFGTQSANRLILLDSSPDLLSARARSLIKREQVVDEDEAHVNWLVGFTSLFVKLESMDTLKRTLLAMKSKQERCQKMSELISKLTSVDCDGEKLSQAADAYFHKIKLAYFYKVEKKFTGDMVLIRCTEPEEEDAEEYTIADYSLSKYVNGKVQTYRVQGNHKSFLSEYCEQVGSYLDSSLNYLTFA